MPEFTAKNMETGEPVKVIVADTIKEESWLSDPKYAWFAKGHQYASTQYMAISALSKCKPEELYLAMRAIARGAKRAGCLQEMIDDLGLK